MTLVDNSPSKTVHPETGVESVQLRMTVDEFDNVAVIVVRLNEAGLGMLVENCISERPPRKIRVRLEGFSELYNARLTALQAFSQSSL